MLCDMTDKHEIYKDIKALPPVIVRADGRNFKESLSRLGFEKPYDMRFAQGMVSAARSLIKDSGLTPEWAFTFSDEINILFKELPFDGRVEKLDSVVPSYICQRAHACAEAGDAGRVRRPRDPGTWR